MLLGINCDSFSKIGYSKYWGEDSYKKMKEFGFSAVDLSILGNHTTDFFNSFYNSDKGTRNKILLHEKELAENTGLFINQVHAPCLSQSRALSEEETRGLIEKIKITIESAHTLGSEYVVVHPFMPNGWSERGSETAKDTFNKNVAYLKELSDYAKTYNVTVCYENMPCIGFSISTPDEILAVLKEVNRDNVKMCFDTGHITAFSKNMEVGKELRKCKDFLRVMHVHDNYGSYDQHNFPGMGIINWKDAIQALKEIGYNGVFSLELVFPDKFSLPVFESSCRLAADMVSDIVNERLI